MGLAILRGFEMHDLCGILRTELANWNPGSLKSRESYVKSLRGFLKEHLDNYPFEVSEEVREGKPELIFAHHNALEVVFNLKGKRELENLMVRVKSLHAWTGTLLLILTGVTGARASVRLDDWINGLNNDREFMSAREILVVHK